MGSVLYPAFSVLLMLLAGNAGADDSTTVTASAPEASVFQYGAPLPSSSNLGAGSPVSSQAGSGSGGSNKPQPVPGKPGGPGKPGPGQPGPLGIPHPGGPLHPPQPKGPPKGGSSSSSSSLSSPASSPSATEDISPISDDLAPSPELSDEAPTYTPAPTPSYPTSPPPVVVTTPPPRGVVSTPPPPGAVSTPPPPPGAVSTPPPPPGAVSTPPPPSKPSPSHPPKVVIKGRVSCIRCSKHFDQFSRRRGLQGVTLELSCPDTSLNVTSGHHGVFKIELHYHVPSGFPDKCTVSVVTSTLPETCNVPIANAASVPILHDTSSNTATYTVHAFEFSPQTCGQKH